MEQFFGLENQMVGKWFSHMGGVVARVYFV